MNKSTYLGLILAACMGVVSEPLFAEVSPAPATSATKHQVAVKLHKKQRASTDYVAIIERQDWYSGCMSDTNSTCNDSYKSKESCCAKYDSD